MFHGVQDIKFPDQGSNSHPLWWKYTVLITALPGESQAWLIFNSLSTFYQLPSFIYERNSKWRLRLRNLPMNLSYILKNWDLARNTLCIQVPSSFQSTWILDNGKMSIQSIWKPENFENFMPLGRLRVSISPIVLVSLLLLLLLVIQQWFMLWFTDLLSEKEPLKLPINSSFGWGH